MAAETITYSITVEHGSDGSYLAWVHELPGCLARGATREAVITGAVEGLADFLPWTRGVASERARALAEREDADLTYALWAGAPRSEPWTAKKAARR